MDRWRVSLFGYRLHVITDDPIDKAIPELTAKLEREGITVGHVSEENYSLEDVFIAVVERARAQGKVAKEE